MPNLPKGRGAAFNTKNRFEKLSFEPLPFESDEDARPVKTLFYDDASKSILAKNNSPDIPFTYSINPYRGCEHGCVYCYARPSHEYLGFSAGLDFETKIMVKRDAPKLLAEEFLRPSWEPQMVAMCGNTDCYQPIERKLRLSRQCLEVFLQFRNPVGIVTKNHLVTRDLDLLKELAAMNLVLVSFSITTLDQALTRTLEPRTSMPQNRFEAVSALTDAGVPVAVMVSPVIPGLTDEEIPSILERAARSGATMAAYTMLRLPGPVEPLFLNWLQTHYPDRAGKITHRLTEIRGGKLSDTRWGKRMRGEGELAKNISRLFKISCAKYGLNQKHYSCSVDRFRLPAKKQLDMFEG